MYQRVAYPLLAQLDAELAHDITLRLLGRASRSPLLLGLLRRRLLLTDPRLHVRLFGCDFPNPLGVAAGLDKNGVAVTALHSLGFGYVEVGTVTPEPQGGNPQPRMFRLQEDQALINRLGFPGRGTAAVAGQLRRLRGPRPILGINLGANKAAVEGGTAVADYLHGMQTLASESDYLAINISSPNTARLRELQGREALAGLLQAVIAERDRLSVRRPVLVKIAPDLSPAELDELLNVVMAHRVDGLIATNTTLARPTTLRSPHSAQQGGLSGRPLADRSNAVIRTIYRATAGRLPIIGVGGIFSATDAWHKLRAGASLVQLYTGFVYGGPLTATTINRDLLQRLVAEGVSQITEIVGTL
ncbi:MAG: quinone-dependent dihydroorotate dehydrogenase [Herpetosiphonaceae bacterium]|nr:quinone-dependent dihydroorotate dehydrogenase [Herpetosiphonaceae bacterium]